MNSNQILPHEFENKRLFNVKIPEWITEIGEKAYAGNPIQSVFIPEFVENIGPGAFAYCQQLRRIDVDEQNENYQVTGGCLIDKRNNTVVASCGNPVVPDGVEVIDYYALSLLDADYVSIPASVKEIRYREESSKYQLPHILVADGEKIKDVRSNICVEKGSYAESFFAGHGYKCMTNDDIKPEMKEWALKHVRRILRDEHISEENFAISWHMLGALGREVEYLKRWPEDSTGYDYLDALTYSRERLLPFLKNGYKSEPKKGKCPVCGCYTVDDGYDICPVCFYEEAYDSISGIPLEQARENYKKFGACSEEFVKHVRPPRENEICNEELED